MNFNFLWPWMALLLLLPVIARYFWPHGRLSETDLKGKQQSLLHPNLEHLKESFASRRPAKPIAQRIQPILLSLLWIFLTIAMMQPQWLEPWSESRNMGYDIMIAVDASHSMEALDFSVNGRQVSRMAVLKGVMNKFIASRNGDRIGLIIFGSQAYLISPLSYDRNAVQQQLRDITANIAGKGTAMGDAIAVGVKKLSSRPPGSRILILIADGANTAGSIFPIEAAEYAARKGVRIYTIGVGSEQTSVLIHENGQLIRRNDLGLEEEILKRLAGITGGAYFRATDSNALNRIYQQIDQLEKSQVSARTVMIPHPLYQWPLGIALLLLLINGLFPDGQLRQLKEKSHAGR